MIWYIVEIALVNLGLGFGVAVCLGRRCRRRYDLAESATACRLQSGGSAAESVAEMTTDGTESVEQPETVAPPMSEHDQTASQSSVKNIQDVLVRYEGQLSSVDDVLRTCTETPDAEKIESCFSSLQEARDEYVENREQAHAAFAEFHEGRDEFNEVCERLRAAIQQQQMQIENVNAAAKAFDFNTDLKQGCREMVSETSKLLDTNHQLRDTLDKTLIEVAREEQWLKTADQAMRDDQLTQLLGRAGLEAGLQEWWEKDPRRSRKLSVGMLDIDGFTQFNEQYGHKVGDTLLRAIARLLVAENDGDYTPTRFSGQQFLLIFPDVDVRHVTNRLELIRQEIAMARFQWHDCDIRVTVSCAATEAGDEDTSDTLFERMEATLQEAKRYGRNRTFLHEGKYPAPVVPPNFVLEEKSITL